MKICESPKSKSNQSRKKKKSKFLSDSFLILSDENTAKNKYTPAHMERCVHIHMRKQWLFSQKHTKGNWYLYIHTEKAVYTLWKTRFLRWLVLFMAYQPSYFYIYTGLVKMIWHICRFNKRQIK